MLRLTTRQRSALGATIRDLANYGAAALVFSPFVSDRGVSWRLILAGWTMWGVFVAIALAIERDWRWKVPS